MIGYDTRTEALTEAYKVMREFAEALNEARRDARMYKKHRVLDGDGKLVTQGAFNAFMARAHKMTDELMSLSKSTLEKSERALEVLQDKDDAAKARLAILRKLEWAKDGYDGQPFCPLCQSLKKNGHTEDCELGKLLKEGR